MRIEAGGEHPQGRGFSYPRFAGEQAHTGAVEQPLETLFEQCQRPVVPQLGGLVAQWGVFQAEVLQIHQLFSSSLSP
jgi:hypothetical protein